MAQYIILKCFSNSHSHSRVLIQSYFYVVSNLPMLFTANTGHSSLLLFQCYLRLYGLFYTIFVSYYEYLYYYHMRSNNFVLHNYLETIGANTTYKPIFETLRWPFLLYFTRIQANTKKFGFIVGLAAIFLFTSSTSTFSTAKFINKSGFCCLPFGLHIYSLYVCLWLCVYHLPIHTKYVAELGWHISNRGCQNIKRNWSI